MKNDFADAFQHIFALPSLPLNPQNAKNASLHLTAAIKPTLQPTPLLSQLLATTQSSSNSTHNTTTTKPPRYLSLSTGMRICYLEWGSPGDDVILLLHDISESADIWSFSNIAPALASRGYHIFALDARGHGSSTWSPDHLYNSFIMTEDVKSFITTKDLYVAPVAVVGCGGVGGVVALTLALDNPSLVGAVVLIDFALGDDYYDRNRNNDGIINNNNNENTTSNDDDASCCNSTNNKNNKGTPSIATAMHNNKNNSSTFSLPWWSMRVGQGAKFHSGEELLEYLCHPLANMSPDMMLQLYTMTIQQQKDTSKSSTTATTTRLREMMQAQYRQPGGAVKSAMAMANNLETSSPSYYYDSDDDADGDELSGGGKISLKMDPEFCFSFDPGHLSNKMKKNSSSSSQQHHHQQQQHLLIICGAPSTTNTVPTSPRSWIRVDDAHTMASHSQSSFNAHVVTIPGGNHWLVADHPVEVLDHLVKFLEGPAINAFQATCNTNCTGHNNTKVGRRRPEVLGLRGLPGYDSLEQAQKALGPRKVPDSAAVQEELNKLRMEEGYISSEDNEDSSGYNRKSGRTALSNNPSDYFGFVG